MFELPLISARFIVCCLIESAQIMYIRFFSFCKERYGHALFIYIKESDFPFSRKHSGKEISVKCCSLVEICAHWVSNYSGKVPIMLRVYDSLSTTILLSCVLNTLS